MSVRAHDSERHEDAGIMGSVTAHLPPSTFVAGIEVVEVPGGVQRWDQPTVPRVDCCQVQEQSEGPTWNGMV